MPLLRKQPFHRQKIPHDLDPEEEVFHCKITNEIFRDYNAFFERIILCNSLVWSCAITGRSGLTFQEAEECEEKAKKNLATFQDSLKKPLLFLATLTHRSRLNDLNDDVFVFAKDRFFIGETLDFVSGSQRLPCSVIAVLPPQYTKANGDIIVIEDSDDDSLTTNSDNKSQKKKKSSAMDPAKFQYKIKLNDSSEIQTVLATTLCRKRGLYSRDRSKLFLKQHCAPVDGLWNVKESTLRKLNLGAAKFEDFFAGPIPEFEVSSVKRKSNAKRSFESVGSPIEFEESPSHSKKVMKNSKGQKVDPEPKVEYVPLPTPEDRALMKEKLKQQKVEEKRKVLEEKETKREEMRRNIEAEKVRRKEEKEKERMKKIEEKRKELELYREWAKPRDDLECDDLKEMPEFVPVHTRVPMELFGDAVMILEFTHVFKSIFDFKQFFPKGFTWGMIESAMMDHEPDGPLCDLLQMLLCALFYLQEEEEDEYQELEKKETAKFTEDKDDELDEELTTNEVIRSATVMALFSQNVLGMPLRDTLLDQFTLSEIVRIHLLSSGARASSKSARFRYQQRGGYTPHDDPGLELKLEDPALVKALASTNVFDLTPGEKSKIIITLIHQILTFAMVRDMIEESSEKLRIKKFDLKQMQWAEQRREREEQALRYKKTMEEKAKEQARRMQQMIAEQNGLQTGGSPVPDNEEKIQAQKEAERQKEHDMETRKKAEFSKKECEALDEIMSLQRMVSVYPIGRDRLFRRYYFFSSLNGLFIEDHELHVPAEMLKPGVATAGPGTKLKLLPELTFQGEHKANHKKSNGDDCIVISDDENGEKNCKSEEVKPKIEEKDVNDDTPPVLESEDSLPDQQKLTQNPTWSFIDTPEHLGVLINCLNTRGFRECALRTALQELKPLLEHSLRDCPTDILSLPDDKAEEARIQALARTRGISSKKAAQDALMVEKAEITMELNLRDAILDMEDRIHVGGLGNLKVKNRTQWREAILHRNYDPQNDNPIFTPTCKPHLNGGEDIATEMADAVPVARDLAKALVQIARGVESRFMKEPLKEEDEAKKKKLTPSSKDKKKKEDGEHSDDESSAHKKNQTLYERWEESLLSSTSLSQVYLHLATLDKSILWAKSALETRCRLCRRKGDPDKMLLCDGCDRGHHMYCLKPPVEKVPTGDWFCSECRPKQAPRSPIRKGWRKTFTEENEEETQEEVGEEEEIEDEDHSDGNVEQDTFEEENGSEAEEEDEVDDSDDDEVTHDDDDDVDAELKENPEDDLCVGCKTPGMLICCDCCPRAYHLHCAKPPLKKVPKGKWMCQVCMGIDRAGKIKIGGGKVGRPKGKTKDTDKAKGKERKSTGSAKLTPTNSRSGSRRESPQDSPVLGRPKKHSLTPLDMANVGPKSKKMKSRPKLSFDSVDDDDQIIRMMKPIMPSSKRANSQQQQLRTAQELVNELIKHEDAWPFLKPVDKKLVPDYYDVIKHPMDFGTIRNKIHAFTYHKPSEILEDVRQIFHNCVEYNNRGSPEYKAYHRLSKFFDKRVKELSLAEDIPAGSNRGRDSV